tara:strand:+ start:112 stop:753 length:642 start_codon:yes stop_codon:yes gene_type:complete
MNIVIIDYKSGNLASLKNSLENAALNFKKNIKIIISNNPEVISKADKLILPGVGDFLNCRKQLLKIIGMKETIEEYIKKKSRPFLGICVGMQLMGNISYERGKNKGLELIDADVIKINNEVNNIRVPHMGWNNIKVKKNLDKGFLSLDSSDFYFVHSYHMKCNNDNDILASVEYGEELVAAVCKDNILGVQFHPEKSQLSGKKFLQQFFSWTP